MTDFEQLLQDPPKKYRPVPFWSWNEKLEAGETRKQIRQMDEAGMGGFFMHARGGLQTGYLSDAWFENVAASLDEAEKCGMLAWGYDENGWPSGFGDGKVPELGLKYQQKFLRCEEVKAPVEGEFTLVNVLVGEHLYHCYFEVNPFYVDTMNGEVTGEFLRSTHEVYREKLQGDFRKMKGFFTDEPQTSRRGIPWSFHLEEEYERLYGESIREHLPKLFYRIDGYAEFRFRFWKLVRDLFTDGFMGVLKNWCKENQSSLTGHMVLEEEYYEHILANGCCMPSYEFMDIPGMDHLCRGMPSVQAEMQLTSAANQLGKKQILSETFAACGWNVSFEDLRKLYEHQMVHGINLLCQHLESYSLRGIRKRDYPASLFRHQPWWKDYKVFNDMVSRIGMLIAEGEVEFHILVLHTIESGWMTCDDRAETDAYAKKLTEVMDVLEDAQLQYHLGESRLIARHGNVEDGRFRIGTQGYSVVIVPPANCLDAHTFDMLCEYKKQGGVVIFTEEIPKFLDGVKTDRVTEFAKTCVMTDCGHVAEYIPKECRLISLEVGEESQSPYIRSTVRKFPEQGMTMYYICNFGEENHRVTVQVKGKHAKLFDALSGDILPVPYAVSSEDGGEMLRIPCEIVSNASCILFVYEEAARYMASDDSAVHGSSLKLAGDWQVAKADSNSLTLDYCDLLVDGEVIARHMPVSDVQEILCSYGKEVHAEIIYHFEVRELAFSACELMLETPELFDVFVNHRRVKKKITGWQHDSCFQTIDMYPYLRQGENEVSLNCDFWQSGAVYQKLADVRVFPSAKNNLTYDMEVEAVYLKGDFGVFADYEFEPAPRNAVRTKGGFYLARAPRTVMDGALEAQGYPFFAGSITLCKKFVLTSDEAEHAVIRFAKLPSIVTDICVNGIHAGKVLWKPYSLDLSEYVREGENEIQITLTGSLRNLLGPFHLEEGETHTALPFYFFHKTNVWGWGDGLNRKWTDDYSFVENGLFFE